MSEKRAFIKGFIVSVSCIRKKPAFFAEQLYKSMKVTFLPDYSLWRCCRAAGAVKTQLHVDVRCVSAVKWSFSPYPARLCVHRGQALPTAPWSESWCPVLRSTWCTLSRSLLCCVARASIPTSRCGAVCTFCGTRVTAESQGGTGHPEREPTPCLTPALKVFLCLAGRHFRWLPHHSAGALRRRGQMNDPGAAVMSLLSVTRGSQKSLLLHYHDYWCGFLLLGSLIKLVKKIMVTDDL